MNWLRSRLATFLTAVVMAATTMPMAYASRAERRLKPLSMDQAQQLVQQLPASSDFPLVMNDKVLSMLNSYLTDLGRVQHLKDSLQRMQDYQPMIETKMKKSGMPLELLAVPLVESGYRNFDSATRDLKDVPSHLRGAGLWMVIKDTGRMLGLKINAKVDQRLDPSVETDAALGLLRRHHREFHKSWLLALAAYQQGNSHVHAQIKNSKHRDPWKLMAEKRLTDYVSRIMAMAIIIKKPELLN